MKDELRTLIDKATRSLQASQELFALGHFDFAASRAYYALFYASEALLLRKGLKFSKHTAIISGIFDHCVQPGDLPRTYHQTLHLAFKLRQRGDYVSDPPITREIAAKLIHDVQEQIAFALRKLETP